MDRFYVYAYVREDRTPYYIGKGSGKRAYRGSRTVNKPDTSRIVIIVAGLSEEDSFRTEKQLISFYRRKDNGSGYLRNRTDGGEGVSGLPLAAKARIGAANREHLKGVPLTVRFSWKDVPKSEAHIANIAASNRGKKRASASSVFHGVSWDKSKKRWTVQARPAPGILVKVCSCVSELDAALAYDRRINEWGLNHQLNFPENQAA